jgi:hypothetical protein
VLGVDQRPDPPRSDEDLRSVRRAIDREHPLTSIFCTYAINGRKESGR